MKQVASGNLIIGGGWSAGLSETDGFPKVLRSSLEGNLWIAQRVIPALAQLHILRSWAAMNVNIDGAPVIGEVPGVPGFYNAVTSNGYTLGPMVGRLTAELIGGGDTGWDLTPFSIVRFA
jgi:glycine/D-amino acid oxidase-like deaminating enzyme